MPQAVSEWSGTPSIRGSSDPVRMALLTFSLIGLQFCWGLEAAYCTPYLLSLGLSKSRTSLVWIAGPLSGLIMQPFVGALSDRSTSRFGRRRPFMVGGAAIVGICLLLLGWTKELVAVVVHDEKKQSTPTIVIAVLAIYVLDFAVNGLQACCRSLIVDTLPINQQQKGSAWAARMSAFGHVIGYLIGTLDLVAIFPAWMGGSTQFKKMTVIAAVSIWLTTGITTFAVTEKVLISSPEHGTSVWMIVPNLLRRTLNLPTRIQAICWCQFWAWIGWFPFLFYSSTWVGETYYRYEHTPTAADVQDALGNVGRLGSVALVLFSSITLVSSVLFPFLIDAPGAERQPPTKEPSDPPTSHLQMAKAFFARISAATKPSLVMAWLLADLAFASIMFWAPFVRSVRLATALVALCGMSWAVGSWAPFAEMGVEINKLSSDGTRSTAKTNEATTMAGAEYTMVHSTREGDEDEDEVEMLESQPVIEPIRSGPAGPDDEGDEPPDSAGELAGVYLGVLNVYTTLPQFVGTFISWLVFSVLEPQKDSAEENAQDPSRWLSTKGTNAIAVCLSVGAVSALIAAEATRRLKKID